jgi:hypothetical protein
MCCLFCLASLCLSAAIRILSLTEQNKHANPSKHGAFAAHGRRCPACVCQWCQQPQATDSHIDSTSVCTTRYYSPYPVLRTCHAILRYGAPLLHRDLHACVRTHVRAQVAIGIFLCLFAPQGYTLHLVITLFCSSRWICSVFILFLLVPSWIIPSHLPICHACCIDISRLCTAGACIADI